MVFWWRNLYDSKALNQGASEQIVFTNTTGNAGGKLAVNISTGTSATADVALNGRTLGKVYAQVSGSEYDFGAEGSTIFTLKNLTIGGNDTITITNVSGGTMRLNYVLWCGMRRRHCRNSLERFQQRSLFIILPIRIIIRSAGRYGHHHSYIPETAEAGSETEGIPRKPR